MTPLEMILSQLKGGWTPPPADGGGFSPPQLPQGVPPRSAGDSMRRGLSAGTEDGGGSATSTLSIRTHPLFEEGNNSIDMVLRRLLTGSNAPPLPDAPLPELSLLDKKQLAAAQPSQPPAIPPGIAVGPRPTPSSDPSRLNMFAPQGGLGAHVSTAGSMRPAAAPPIPVQPRPMQQPKPAAGAPAADPDAKADEATNWPGLIRDILTSTMAGAATAQGPRAGNIGAFGTGYTTAENSMRSRQQAENAAKLAQQKMGFEQTLATRKDGRDERGADRDDKKMGFEQTLARRKDGREERGADRDDEKLGLSKSEQARKDAESKVSNQVAVEKLMKVRDDGTLPLAVKIKIQDQLNQYADKVNKNGMMMQKELDGALTTERGRLEQYYGVQNPSAAAPAPTQKGRDANGNIVTFTLQNGKWVNQP